MNYLIDDPTVCHRKICFEGRLGLVREYMINKWVRLYVVSDLHTTDTY